MKKKSLKEGTQSGLGCFILFFSPFVFVGLFTLYLSVPAIFMSQVSKFWTKTTATVESVEMHVSKRGSSRKSKTTYEVYVKYAYIIGNKKYRGSNVGFGYDQNNTEDHSAIFNSLKYAKKISIYVNPFDLEESVITTGLNNSVICVFIFSVMWNSMIGMMILQLVYKDGPKQENEIFNKAN